MVEHLAVNERVLGSNPSRGVDIMAYSIYYCISEFCEKERRMTKAKNLDAVHVILVGAPNNLPWLQEYLGTLILKKEGDTYVPFLRHRESNEMDDLAVTISWKRPGDYRLEVPRWHQHHGLSIRLTAVRELYRFTTGLHPYDSGMSGPLVFGGGQLVEIFDLAGDLLQTHGMS